MSILGAQIRAIVFAVEIPATADPHISDEPDKLTFGPASFSSCAFGLLIPLFLGNFSTPTHHFSWAPAKAATRAELKVCVLSQAPKHLSKRTFCTLGAPQMNEFWRELATFTYAPL